MGFSDTAVAAEASETRKGDSAPKVNLAAVTAATGGNGDGRAPLFQKAYQKMVALSRLEEQLQSIFDQRRLLQGELRDLQQQINGEFERLLEESSQTPQRLLQELAAAEQ